LFFLKEMKNKNWSVRFSGNKQLFLQLWKLTFFQEPLMIFQKNLDTQLLLTNKFFGGKTDLIHMSMEILEPMVLTKMWELPNTGFNVSTLPIRFWVKKQPLLCVQIHYAISRS
jgi:hypothetical protein